MKYFKILVLSTMVTIFISGAFAATLGSKAPHIALMMGEFRPWALRIMSL
jgi:hypothetical protein